VGTAEPVAVSVNSNFMHLIVPGAPVVTPEPVKV